MDITALYPLTYYHIMRCMSVDEMYLSVKKLKLAQCRELATFFCRETIPDETSYTDHLADKSFALLTAGFLEDPVRYAEAYANQIASDIIFTHRDDLESLFDKAIEVKFLKNLGESSDQILKNSKREFKQGSSS